MAKSLLAEFPAGLKYEPTDVELLDHLAAKCGVGGEKPHRRIDDFILSIDDEAGICYEHPDNLSGTSKDGSCVHFFYRTTNAYAKGNRKRRKIENGSSSTRWQKCGKTKPIFKNKVQVGFRYILVLHGTVVGCSTGSKTNWIMHEYHLGTELDEKGEYVVSKVFYKAQKQVDLLNEDGVHLLPQEPNLVDQRDHIPFSTHELRDHVKETTWEDDSETTILDIFHDSSFFLDQPYRPLSESIIYNDVVGRATDTSLEIREFCGSLDFNKSDTKCFEKNYLPTFSTNEAIKDYANETTKETTGENDSQTINLDLFCNSLFVQDNPNV